MVLKNCIVISHTLTFEHGIKSEIPTRIFSGWILTFEHGIKSEIPN